VLGRFMRAQELAASVILFGLAGLLVVTEPTADSPLGSNGSTQIRNSALPASGGPPQSAEQLWALHRKCIEAGERLRRDVAAMVPGRTWTWRLDSERSRAHLEGLQHDLKDFWDAEADFEANLQPDQRSKLNSQFVFIHKLFQHLEQDAQSLDTELQRSYPTRWHVANDVSDMRKEIDRWRRLHRRIAEELGLNT
jgi:hypothetical protein